jgi:cytochrome c oxidase subunit 1
MFLTMLGLSLVGVVMILAAIGLGRFAGAWTFLYPLPGKSMGIWGPHAAAAFVGGLVFIGVGFLLFYLDCAIAILRRYGSLWKALGMDQLFRSGPLDTSLPPTVVASTMVVIINVLGILAGAVVLVMSLVGIYVPTVTFDALLMKNLIFFFGHVFINATIYMAVIGVYEILPRYTSRPWLISRPFLSASPSDGLCDAEVGGSHGTGAVISQRNPHTSRHGLRRARQHSQIGPEMGPAAAAARVFPVRMGGRRNSGDPRRHDPRESRHA